MFHSFSLLMVGKLNSKHVSFHFSFSECSKTSLILAFFRWFWWPRTTAVTLSLWQRRISKKGVSDKRCLSRFYFCLCLTVISVFLQSCLEAGNFNFSVLMSIYKLEGESLRIYIFLFKSVVSFQCALFVQQHFRWLCHYPPGFSMYCWPIVSAIYVIFSSCEHK